MTSLRARAAFTLFEVMISLLILTTAILATIAMLPIGLQAQQLARSQMYAASTAVSLMYQFHNPVGTFDGISRLAPQYNGVPGTDSTSTVGLPYHGWAEQLRLQSVHASAYQANAEQALCGWFNGVLPVPPEIAKRLDSDNDEIQNLLDQGGQLFYPDPNLLAGFNQGATSDKTIQVLPSPELQKLVFAFLGYPQQNALSTFPTDSYPYYESYPFPPSWLSVQAHGRETRLCQYISYGNVGNSRGGSPYGSRSGIAWDGLTTADWSWEGGLLSMDDAGHAQYEPVQWGTPMRPGQDVPYWCANKAIDDPNSSDEYQNVDPGVAFYEGNGNHIGRNWRYFATASGNGVSGPQNMWMTGNGQPPIFDPYYTNAVYQDPATGVPWSQEWAWFCFQRLAGVDAAWVSGPQAGYTNSSQLNNTPIAASTVSSVVSDTNPPIVPGLPGPYTVAVAPAMSFPAHAPATFYRAGWLPIRGLLTNPDSALYEGMQYTDPDTWNQSGALGWPASTYKTWAPAGWQDSDTHMWGIYVKPGTGNGQRMWNVAQAAGMPRTSRPAATYEMRANYRDRALDLWQAVMPTHSNLAQLTKNPDPFTYTNPFSQGALGESNGMQTSTVYAGLVEDQMGGTMVDCCKYEYPPTELDRFQFILPSQLSAADWPIHPAQIEALSFLAHAAMMVTGYGPPFDQPMTQDGLNHTDLAKVSWESLNWTYNITNEEEYANETAGAANPPYPQLPIMNTYNNTNGPATQTAYNAPGASNGWKPAGMGGQGIVKDALVVAADVLNPYGAGVVSGNQIKQNLNDSTTWYIDVCNPTAYDFVVYPGDEIVLEPSYYQWFYRHDVPTRPGGPSWWGQADPHDVMPYPDMSWSPWNYYESYDTDTNWNFPNLNYKLQTFRVVAVEPITLNPMSANLPNTYPAGATQCTYTNGPAQTAPNSPPSPPTPATNIPAAIHPNGAPQWVGGYMGYPQPQPGSVYGEEISWGTGHGPQPLKTTLSFQNGLAGMRLWLNAPIPSFPEFLGDAHIRPGYVNGSPVPDKNGTAGAFNGSPMPGNITGPAEGTGILAPFPNAIDPGGNNAYVDPISLHAGVLIRRVSSPSDRAFARKVYEMCLQWAQAYAAEFPNDFGAPRMSNHATYMDQPLALFDLFFDAANGGLTGKAVRSSPLGHQTSDGTPTGEGLRRQESFYRWMVPNNYVPQSWFYQSTTWDSSQHMSSHLAPGPARYDYFNALNHNLELQEPGGISNYDDLHFWITKAFSPFERTRRLKFWSVDWKSYQDAEMVPSAPADYAKHNRYARYDWSVKNYSAISPNGDYGYGTASLGDGHSPLCGLPESLYVWTDASRATRYGDVVSGERAGYLYQDWGVYSNFTNSAYSNAEPVMPNGQPAGADVEMGHWGADRNGNGKLDIGPVPPSTRLRAVSVGEYLYYDPVLRLSVSN